MYNLLITLVSHTGTELQGYTIETCNKTITIHCSDDINSLINIVHFVTPTMLARTIVEQCNAHHECHVKNNLCDEEYFMCNSCVQLQYQCRMSKYYYKMWPKCQIFENQAWNITKGSPMLKRFNKSLNMTSLTYSIIHLTLYFSMGE